MTTDPLHAKKLAAAFALASGDTSQQAADAAGVHRATIERWKQDPAFQAEVRAITDEARAANLAKISRLRDSMLDLGALSLDHLATAAASGDPEIAVAVLRTLKVDLPSLTKACEVHAASSVAAVPSADREPIIDVLDDGIELAPVVPLRLIELDDVDAPDDPEGDDPQPDSVHLLDTSHEPTAEPATTAPAEGEPDSTDSECGPGGGGEDRPGEPPADMEFTVDPPVDELESLPEPTEAAAEVAPAPDAPDPEAGDQEDSHG